MRDIAFMPQRDILEGSLSIRPDHAGETADLLAHDWVFLVGHGRRTLLALREVLAGFTHLSTLQMSNFQRYFFKAGAQNSQSSDEVGVPIAPEMKKISGFVTQCFYGQDEADDSLCTEADAGALTVIPKSGGHHFDKNYAEFADQIVAAVPH